MTEDLDARPPTATPTTSASASSSGPGPAVQPTGWRPGGLEALAVVLVTGVLSRGLLGDLLTGEALRTWSTIFLSITMQALPFLVLGVTVSGAIAALVPADAIARLMPKGSLLAVPAAGLAGAALPGCECGSVPIAGRLTARGAAPAAAFAFMLAAPAINPVVMVATAVAFPGRPDVVAARFVASLLAAVVVGWLWHRLGDDTLLRDVSDEAEPASRWRAFSDAAVHDLVHAGGWLVAGAAAAAALQVVVPRGVLDTLAGNPVLAVAALSVLAVVLAICSEADAFIAVGLSQFSLTARLAFLVVGPAVDLKLIALQAGVFGKRFALRFAPLAFVVAVASAVLVALAAGAITGDPTWSSAGLVVDL